MKSVPLVAVRMRWPALMLYVLSLCLGFVLPAQASPSLAAEVARAASFDTLFAEYPKALRLGIETGLRDAGSVDPQRIEKIGSAVAGAFNPDAMLAQMVSHLDAEMTQTQLSDVQGWMTSPLGQKIIAAELAAARVEAIPTIDAQRVALQKQFHGSWRERAFSEFERMVNSTDTQLELALATQIALAEASMPGAPPEVLAQMRAMVESNRFMMRGLIEQQIYAVYLFTYRDLSDADLQGYMQFLRSDAGNTYIRTVNKALKSLLVEPLGQVGRTLLNAGG